MVALKFILLTVILSSLLIAELAQAAPGHKKSRQQGKSKKSIKAPFKTAPANNNSVQHRNAKMNVYSPRSWPSTNNYYHAASSPLYLRSAPGSTMYYPMRWFNSPNYFNTGSMMPSTYLRRADDFSSMGSMPTMTPSLSSSSSMMSHEGTSRTPTLIDLSAFTGSNSGLLDNSFSSQHLWSLPESSLATPSPKSKFNLFNSFSLNEDEGFFGGLFNQFK